MAKLNHTPGPWKWEFLTESIEGFLLVSEIEADFSDGLIVLQPMECDNSLIGTLWFRNLEKNEMQPISKFPNKSHPDARLIAAAPELLEGCIASLKTIKMLNAMIDLDAEDEITPEKIKELCTNEFPKIINAIKKATGKELAELGL